MEEDARVLTPRRLPRFSRPDGAIGALILAAGCGAAALSWLQPMYADDYVYGVSRASHPGIIGYVLHWYRIFSGRATSTAFIWLWQASRPLYAVLIAFALLLSALLVVMLGRGRRAEWDTRALSLWGLALAVVWFAMPALGEVAIWRTGAATYLLTLPLMLGFLLPFRFAMDPARAQMQRPLDLALTVPMAVLGLALGLSQESAVAGTAVVLIAMLAMTIRNHRVRLMPAHLWAGAAGLVAGGVLMMVAPGTTVRFAEQSGLAPSIPVRLFYFGLVLVKAVGFVLPTVIPWLLLVGLLAVPFHRLVGQREERTTSPWLWPSIWSLGAAGSLLPFAVVPYPGGGRIYSLPFTFLVLAVFAFFGTDRKLALDALPARWVTLGVALLLVAMLVEIGASIPVQLRFRQELAARQRIVESQTARGAKDLVVPPLVIQPHRLVPHADIVEDPRDFRNVAVATWLHVRTIRTAGHE